MNRCECVEAKEYSNSPVILKTYITYVHNLLSNYEEINDIFQKKLVSGALSN